MIDRRENENESRLKGNRKRRARFWHVTVIPDDEKKKKKRKGKERLIIPENSLETGNKYRVIVTHRPEPCLKRDANSSASCPPPPPPPPLSVSHRSTNGIRA